MYLTWTMESDEIAMVARAVAHVLFKSVSGKLLCVVAHDVVAGDLCEDGGGGDGFHLLIAFDDSFVRVIKELFVVTVDESHVGNLFEMLETVEICEAGRVENVVFVDDRMRNDGDGIINTVFKDFGKKSFALLWREKLAVIQTGKLCVFF